MRAKWWYSIALVLGLAVTVKADEKALIEHYNRIVSLFNEKKYAECRAEAAKFIAAAEKVQPSDPAHERAQTLLEYARELPAKSYHNAFVDAHDQAQKASRDGKHDEAVKHWTQAVAEAKALHELKPEPGSTDKQLADARTALARSQQLHALATGAAPEGKLPADLKLPRPTLLSTFVPSFSLPRWDQSKLFRLTDLPERALLIIHVGTINTAGDMLNVQTLRNLRTKHGERLHTLTFLLDVPKEKDKLDAFVKEHAAIAAVVGDDHGEFRQDVLPDSLTYPAYVVITPDRRALMLTGQPEELAVALSHTVATELARAAPAARPRGPMPYYPPAPPIQARKVGGSEAQLRFGQRPALVAFLQTTNPGHIVKNLAALPPQLTPHVDVLAVVRSPSATTAAALAKDMAFATWWMQGDAPAVYGPPDRDRLVLISPRGHVIKIIPLFTNLDYGQTLRRYAEVLSGALPADVDSPGRPNLASRAAGAAVAVSSAAEEGSADTLLDGRCDVVTWKPTAEDHKREVQLTFLGGQPARFDRVVLDNPAGVQDVELLADGRSLGRCRLEPRGGPQAFPVPPTTARSLTVRLLSVYNGKAFGLGEVAVEEAAGVQPPLSQRLAAVLGSGFTDEFAQRRLTFWEQSDYVADDTPATWVIRDGKLTQAHSARAGDHRTTALLHVATCRGDFRLQATLRGSARAAGLIFGFRDWENFDRLVVLESQSQSGRGDEVNSLRLERWRNGQLTVLSVHGESAPQNQELRLEVIGQGRRLAVTLQGQVIMNLPDAHDPTPGRAGLFTSASEGMTFEHVRLTPLTQPVALAEVNPLSYAAGASIVWLSGQKTGRDDAGWAYHLLRQPVLAPPGAWEVTSVAGQPPEIVLAFRDAAPVTLTELGFILPEAKDAAQHNWTRKVEVLVTQNAPLDVGRYQSVGTFDLAARPGLQTFPLPRPVSARYVMLRLLANHGGPQYTLARVTARLGAPLATPATATGRGPVDPEFHRVAAAEREPNDQPGQATPLPSGQTVDAQLQPGEVDFFRLPPPPSKGRASLRLHLAALPWLRLNADVLDAKSTDLSPPLARVSAGQAVTQTRSPQPTPSLVRVQMPGSALSFVLDNSGSMTGREDDVRAAVQHFLAGVATTEEVEVLRFGSNVVPLVPFTRDRDKLAAVPAAVRMEGNTALYQALMRAMTGLADRAGSRAIVLLSDGMNTVPGPDFAAVCRRLRASPVPIYVIGVGWDLFEYDAASGNTCHDLLRNLALATGGRFFFAPTSGQLDALYREIATELRGATRYRLRADWEVHERQPELMALPRLLNARPLEGRLPPAAAELTAAAPLHRLGPLSAGLPPLPLELSSAGAPPPRLVQAPLPLTGATELTVLARSPVSPLRPPLPGAIELSTGSPPPTAALAPLPEFGQLTLHYRPPAGAVATEAALPPAVRPAFLLILDSSGSMAQEIGGEKKYLAARKVLHELLRAMPDDATVGLRLFGISRFWNRDREPQPNADDPRYNTDSDLVVRIGRLDPARRQDLTRWIDGASPTGGTPLCYSLIQGLQDFPAERPGPRTVVLVSDGMESQGGKLDDVARAYGDADTGLVIHVVGFDVGKAEEQNQLKALARIGRGNYYHAADARQLADALRQALRGARYVVHDDTGKHVIARGDINGAPLDLPPGTYRLSIPGTPVAPVQVRVENGKAARITLDEQGKLSVPSPL